MLQNMSWNETSTKFEHDHDQQDDSSNYLYEILSIETLDGVDVHVAPSGACAGCWHKLANENIEGEQDKLKKVEDNNEEERKARGGKYVISKHLYKVNNKSNKSVEIVCRSDEDNNSNKTSTNLDTCPIALMDCNEDQPEITSVGDNYYNDFEHHENNAEDVQLRVNITLKKKKIIEATSIVNDLQSTNVVDDNQTKTKCRDHHQPLATKMLALITTNGSNNLSPRSQQSNKVFGFGKFRFTRHLAFILILILSVIALVFLQHGFVIYNFQNSQYFIIYVF